MTTRRLRCDVAVIGGSLGGVAAALAACEAGRDVVLSEASDWLGGQVTSQGVTPLDEHEHIERFGGTRRYVEFRERARRHYRASYGAPERMPDGAPLNPGNGWVSRLCFEPRVALAVLEAMLAPHLEQGRLRLLLGHEPVAAEVRGDTVHAVTLRGPDGAGVELQAAIVLDATDLGDLLPLTGTDAVTGAESRDDTGEPSAQPGPAEPGVVQSFTLPAALAYRPGERHVTPRPPGYERMKRAQPFSLDLAGGARHRMFDAGPGGELPFWSYRRVVDAALLRHPDHPVDLALVNWAGNDYRDASLLAGPEERARALAEARTLTLAFVHWLQTECPRDPQEGDDAPGDAPRRGYPELQLRPDVLGSDDGVAKAPYVRESRRLLALARVREHDIGPTPDGAARARPWRDAVGIGWYPIDLHPCVGRPDVSRYAPTLPFQVPLGALVPRRTRNLLAACKNVGTTHLANGAYRLQPVEWAIGEAAGTLAAYCCERGCTPRQVHADEAHVRAVQTRLLRGGAPLAWTLDVPPEHPLFVPAQQLLLAGAIVPGSDRHGRLTVDVDAPLEPAERDRLSALGVPKAGLGSLADACVAWADVDARARRA